tara:strand:+ start:2611 stop:3078 length:468 start_codon:yes stop_codon:yes gene_type:complete
MANKQAPLMMGNLNTPATPNLMMGNMAMGGRPPVGMPPNRSMPGGGYGGPYGPAYLDAMNAHMQGRRVAGYYDTDVGLIMAELDRQDKIDAGVNEVIDDLKYHYTLGSWGGRRPIDDILGIPTKPPHDPDDVYLPWHAPGSGVKRVPTHRNPRAK